jgi:RNA polymerase sigma-70 factor (ECF subfamily)
MSGGRASEADAPAFPVADAEAALVTRARQGDEAAFARLMDTHLERVWTIVWRVMRHREDTEDVVQEVFLAAWRALPGFRGEARFSTWLQTIAVCRALNYRARGAERVRRASSPFATTGDPSLAPTVQGELADERPGSSPLRRLESAELRMRLALCLEKVPTEWRAILALREGQASLSYEEIAGTLGLALGTVRSRLARARLALRDCVEGEA